MKQKKTALHFAQQLEDFQTNRKAKEVSEIFKFDSLKEGLKQRYLTVSRRMEKLRQKSLRKKLEHPVLTEENVAQDKARMLRELAEFEQQFYNMQIDAPDNEFDIIADIQGFHYSYPQAHQTLKQLPEASTDAFLHDLNALTEQELQKELEQNEKALQDSLRKPGRLELSHELSSQEPESRAVSAGGGKREELKEELPQNVLLDDPEKQEHSAEEAAEERKASGSSLIYFRSSSSPSKKG